MPFLYDVWNVKLQQCAKGLVWSRGGKHFSKTFSIFYMLNSKNRVFNPYFWIGACPMRKTLLRIIRELNLLSFWLKNYRFLWNFCLAIFIGNPSLRLSEVLLFFSYLPENYSRRVRKSTNKKILALKCAWQKYQHRSFLNYCRLYIFKICALWHAIFNKKNSASLCFLDGFGIAVWVFSY